MHRPGQNKLFCCVVSLGVLGKAGRVVPFLTKANMNNEPQPGASGLLPSTQWTQIIAVIQDGSAPEAAWRALGHFCESYDAAIRQFFLRQGCNEHDARDHAQEFFATRICRPWQERDGFLLRVERQENCKFRTYLFKILKNFYVEEIRHRNTIKGGGRVPHEPVDGMEIAGPEARMGLDFDRSFALELIKKVVDDSTHSQTFLAYLQNKDATVGEVQSLTAEKLGMSVEAFKVGLHRFRRKLGKELWKEVSKYAGPDEEEIKSEIVYLLARVTENPP